MRISDWSSDVCSSDLQRFVTRADVHAAALVFGAVHARGRITAAGAVDRLQSLDARAKIGGHRVERGVLVGKFGVAADGRDGDAEQAGSRRRTRLETPVAVPIFGEQRRDRKSTRLNSSH